MRSIIICLFASFLAVHAIEMRVSRMFNNFFLEDPYINPWLGEMMFEAADKISEVGSTSTSRRGSDEKKVKTVSLKNVKAPEKDKKIDITDKRRVGWFLGGLNVKDIDDIPDFE